MTATGFGAGTGGGAGVVLRAKSDLRLSFFFVTETTGFAGAFGTGAGLTALTGEADFFIAGAGADRVAGFLGTGAAGGFPVAAGAGRTRSPAKITEHKKRHFTRRE